MVESRRTAALRLKNRVIDRKLAALVRVLTARSTVVLRLKILLLPVIVVVVSMVVVIETAGSRSAELRPGAFALACAEDHVLEELTLSGLE